MLIEPPSDKRPLKTVALACDLAVVGGGLAGVCCAITAARAGVKVVLVQDRPVLGGNASSEVRLWILGATSHMGNNNRWAREGGVVDEILIENLYRNPEGNPLILDTILLEKVVNEPNITLLLNTAVHDLDKSDADTIRSVRAFCSQNSTQYDITAPLFCDASGDGIVGFLAGAAFRIGAESRDEFGEGFAPETPSRDLLGHTIYFYSRDTGRPVRFVPPAFALADITKIPRWRDLRMNDSGCRLWWLEWGGKLDTIHDSETIKWELWKVAYGVWNHIKNSGQFPEAETLTLEWVGTIPGKRESRRFEGPYMLTQLDIVEQRAHPDAVSFGGWAIDLHPVDGVYSGQPGCTQWHSKGVYQIPYRCLYSRNIKNLFLAGRIISASHVAFGSTRVMATCAHSAQAVGQAAAQQRLPADVDVRRLQRELLRRGQFIPGVALEEPENLALSARISASSELQLAALPDAGRTQVLDASWGQMLPVQPGPVPEVAFVVDATRPTTLRAELRASSRPENHTPDVTLAVIETSLAAGRGQRLALRFDAVIDQSRYAFVCLMKNEAVSVHLSEQRLTGVLAVCHNANKAVAKSATQTPPPGIGIDTFEFWTPRRRPGGHNFALSVNPPLTSFGAANLTNGFGRPVAQPNAWVAGPGDLRPSVTLTWDGPVRIGAVELVFDCDWDHPAESVLMGHPESRMPFCIQDAELIADGRSVASVRDNHQSLRIITFDNPIEAKELAILFAPPPDGVPAALFEVRCLAPRR